MSSTPEPEIEEIKKYYYSGDLFEHYFLKNGKKNGEFKCFRIEGTISSSAFFKDGKEHGECKWYNPSGELSSVCFKKNGEYHGEYKWFYDNNVLGVHCFYKDGGLHGEYKRYDEVGMHFFFNNDDKEALSEYVEDINNITDDEFMNLSMIFGDNFFESKTFIGAALCQK